MHNFYNPLIFLYKIELIYFLALMIFDSVLNVLLFTQVKEPLKKIFGFGYLKLSDRPVFLDMDDNLFYYIIVIFF